MVVTTGARQDPGMPGWGEFCTGVRCDCVQGPGGPGVVVALWASVACQERL